jgi:hypothetical protein
MTIACAIQSGDAPPKLDTQRALVVEQVEIHDSHGRIGELSDVALEEERLAVFESAASNTVTTASFILPTVALTFPISRTPPTLPTFSIVYISFALLVLGAVDQRDTRNGWVLPRAELVIEPSSTSAALRSCLCTHM